MRIGALQIGNGTLVVILAILAAIVLAAVLSGCSAKFGPGEFGWASWDVCGYEGGVAVELNVMAIGGRLGCTNPEVDQVEPEPEPSP